MRACERLIRWQVTTPLCTEEGAKMNRPLIALVALITFVVSVDTSSAQSADDWRKQGVDALQSDSPEKAVFAYTKVLELNSRDTDAYFGRAMAYVNLQKFPEAIADLSKVIELDPGSGGGNVYFLRGQLYHASGYPQQAAADYISAARLGHESAQEILTKSGISWR
jgi:tetratricopeptide (TPR) repeat protein